MKLAFALLAGSLFVLSACGAAGAVGPAGPAGPPGPAGPSGKDGSSGAQVAVTLKEMAITLDRTTVAAGAITFKVQNTGAVTHEVVVIRSDLAIDKLPADADQADKVSEDGSQGESGDLEAGKTATFTLHLNTGHYLLICNLPGHYGLGMRVALTVN